MSLLMNADETVADVAIFVRGKYPVHKLTFTVFLLKDIEVFFFPLKHLVD